MAVTAREYELKLSVADAEKKVAELNEQLEIQEQVIKDLEKASFKYNKRLEDTVKIQKRDALKKRIKQIIYCILLLYYYLLPFQFYHY